jgi:hypothetical protein
LGVGALAAGTASSVCYDTTTLSGYKTLATCSSDARLKINKTTLDASTTLAQIMELNPVSYNWDPRFASDTAMQFGLIAQEVAQIWPNLVSTTSPTALTPDGTFSINFNGLYGPIIAAIQAIERQILALENAVSGFAQKFTTHELCVDDVCVSRDQFLAMVEASGSHANAPAPETTAVEPTPDASSTPSVPPASEEASSTPSTPSEPVAEAPAPEAPPPADASSTPAE